MARSLVTVMFIFIVPTVLGLSLVKLNERQKVGLPMFAYSKLNISDLNSMAEKFKQFFADVRESLDEYVESLTASGDGELQENNETEIEIEVAENVDKIEEVNIDQLKMLINKQQEKKNTVVEEKKENVVNGDVEIKLVANKVNEDKPQDIQPKENKIVNLEKQNKGQSVEEKPVLLNTLKVLEEKDAVKQIDTSGVVLKETKVKLEDKEPLNVNKVVKPNTDNVDVKKETAPKGNENVKEVRTPEPKAKIDSDSKPNSVPRSPQKVEQGQKEEPKVESGLTEEL